MTNQNNVEVKTGKMIEILRATQKELIELRKEMSGDEVFFDDENIQIGICQPLAVIDKKNAEKVAYQQIEISVKTAENRIFTKRYSIDFYRKFVKVQLGIEATKIEGCVIAFKPAKFKNIGWLAFMTRLENDSFKCVTYVEEGADFSDRLAKLGL